MLRLVRHAVRALFWLAAYIAGMTAKHRLTDNSAEFAELRATCAQIPDFAWRIMLGYNPKGASAAGAWTAVRSFTIETAAAMHPDTYDVARRLMTLTARFHMWIWARTGTDLTVRRVYTQLNIDRYLSAAYKDHSASHRWGVSRQLVKVGRELADADLVALPLPEGKVRAPFSAKQIATMHSWANSLTTTKKRQNAQALLGLAGGAGLTAAEIVEARVSDIDIDGDVVFVNVLGAQPRRVPVRRAWARVLLRSIEGREHTSEVLFRGPRIDEYPPRIIQTFLTDHPAPVRPTPAVLRAAWIVHHINNHIPLQVLRDIAGFDHYDSLVRYYEHANVLDATDFTAQLVGAEVTR
ncbi:tyrosine-type recombinase/integrase [Microbacterium sp. NPDC059771]|uniref:tyrosine-type recombinase/integrase n=1 Tax=Microbacterium sp. NPDC059771 TaxID=3346941 RepID=UPI00364BF67D